MPAAPWRLLCCSRDRGEQDRVEGRSRMTVWGLSEKEAHYRPAPEPDVRCTVANTCFLRSRWAGADWCGDQSKAPPPAINSRRAAAQLEADCQAGRCWEAFSYCVSVPDRVFPLRADCPVPPSELAALNEHALAAPLAARIPIGDHERPLAAAGRLYPSMRHSTLTALTRRL